MKNRGTDWSNYSPQIKDQKYIYAYTEKQYKEIEWQGKRDGKGLIKKSKRLNRRLSSLLVRKNGPIQIQRTLKHPSFSN